MAETGTTEPASPKTRIQGENRRAILDAALAVFAARGYAGATLDEVARVAGMSKPNLLYYFRGKEEIYRGTLESTVETWLAPLEAMDPDGDPIEEVAGYIRAKLAMSRDMPEASRLFASEILHGAPVIRPFLETTLRELVERKAAVLQAWIDEGRLAAVSPVHLLFMIWATTQHYADFRAQVDAVAGGDGEPVDEAAETVMTVFVNGLRPR